MANRGQWRAVVWLVLATPGVACAPPKPNSELSGHAAQQASTQQIFVALSPDNSASGSSRYRLFAASPLILDPTSVVFCFDTAEVCQANGKLGGTQPLQIAALAKTTSDGAAYFETNSDVALTGTSQAVTVLAQDFNGIAYTETLHLKSKDSIPGTTEPSDNASGTPNTGDTADASNSSTSPNQGQSDSKSACHKAPDAYTCEVEQEVARLTNLKRQQAGLAPLTFDKRIGYVARLWSQEQANRNTISHEWFNSGEWARQFEQEFKTRAPRGAENVAQNIDAGSATATAQRLVDMWWGSAPHRANMKGNYRNIGVGFVKKGTLTYATQNFAN